MSQLMLSHCRICAVLRVIVNLALMSVTGHQRRFERAPAISDLLPNIAVSQQTTFRATTRIAPLPRLPSGTTLKLLRAVASGLKPMNKQQLLGRLPSPARAPRHG